MGEKVYSVEEAAQRLGVTTRSVQNWLRRGVFPGAYKLLPGGVTSPYRIPERDWEALEQQRQAE